MSHDRPVDMSAANTDPTGAKPRSFPSNTTLGTSGASGGATAATVNMTAGAAANGN